MHWSYQEDQQQKMFDHSTLLQSQLHRNQDGFPTSFGAGMSIFPNMAGEDGGLAGAHPHHSPKYCYLQTQAGLKNYPWLRSPLGINNRFWQGAPFRLFVRPTGHNQSARII
jgi:hypothetical protein